MYCSVLFFYRFPIISYLPISVRSINRSDLGASIKPPAVKSTAQIHFGKNMRHTQCELWYVFTLKPMGHILHTVSNAEYVLEYA